jgi:hypothetical protein
LMSEGTVHSGSDETSIDDVQGIFAPDVID